MILSREIIYKCIYIGKKKKTTTAVSLLFIAVSCLGFPRRTKSLRKLLMNGKKKKEKALETIITILRLLMK